MGQFLFVVNCIAVGLECTEIFVGAVASSCEFG